MTVKKLITAGPSKWDLMQSLFSDCTVMFTLEQNVRIEGEVKTLHKHKEEPRLSEVDEDYHVNAVRLDWLIYIQFEYPKYADYCVAYIEYDMTTRSGLCVIYTDEEFQNADFPHLSNEWSRMMEL